MNVSANSNRFSPNKFALYSSIKQGTFQNFDLKAVCLFVTNKNADLFICMNQVCIVICAVYPVVKTTKVCVENVHI